MDASRIHQDTPEAQKSGHYARYHLAAGLCEPGVTVIDAACGIGYGADIIDSYWNLNYVGVDIDVSEARETGEWEEGCASERILIGADLVSWEPDFEFDVAVGFETIEHLSNYDTYIRWMKEARRWVILSCPVVPTVGTNPYHLHDFQSGDLARLFEDDERWSHFQTFGQPSEHSEISMFRRIR